MAMIINEMNLSKIHDYFQPENYRDRIHILGCGSVGSTLAENLARCGLMNFTLWDFDVVEAKNIVNQMFTSDQIGMAKVDAVKDIICRINPTAEKTIEIRPDGYNGERLSGYVFLAMDNIDLRKMFFEKNKTNLDIKAVFDFRTELESAQHYAADWRNSEMKKFLWETMDFTHEEAHETEAVSACGITLGVATTVRLICGVGVNNFLNYLRKGELKKMILFNGFDFFIDVF